jgi:hypothetical protein
VSGSQGHTTVEESVMSSARAFLYGHPLAWSVPERPGRQGVAARSTVGSRLAAVRAAGRRAFGGRGTVAVEPGGCA